MPAWIFAALSLLQAGRPGFSNGGAVPGHLVGPIDPILSGGFLEEEKKKRRRRRRALTASDRADIAFIESILGKAAGKSFAMIIATRA